MEAKDENNSIERAILHRRYQLATAAEKKKAANPWVQPVLGILGLIVIWLLAKLIA